MNTLLKRLTALFLTLALLALPASALTLDQARELLAKNYVDPVPQSVLDKPTIQEMLGALGDPYTEYLTAPEYAEFLASMADSTLVGIGVVTTVQPDGLLIEQVLDDSPAQRGGLLPGDVIVAVDDRSVAGLSAQEANALIQGEADTQVSITYLRSNLRHTIRLTRQALVIPATDGAVLEGGVGYISCATWGEETPGHFRDLIGEMDGQVSCWLVDLRGNTGGYTQAAADVAGLFCGAGDMIYLRLRDPSGGEADPYAYDIYTSRAPSMTQKPLVILVDGFTASASEAFCSAIRDYGRGVVVGSRTFGKGVAQGIWDDRYPNGDIAGYFQEGDAFKITISRFFSPAGNTTDTLGVMPEFLVDDELSADVGWLLASGVSGEGEDFLSFPGELTALGRCQVSLDHLKEEGWKEVYDALLASLPQGTQLYLNGKETTRGELERRYGLAQSGDPFPDWRDSQSPYGLASLKTYGLIHGKDDGLYHPQDGLTRAELCQMLYNALNCQSAGEDAPFSDVAADAWYAEAVNAMWNRGLLQGVGDGRFDPEGPLDCQQLITIMARLARWLNDDVDFEARSATAEDMDYWTLMDYDAWAVPSAWLLGYVGPEDANLLWADVEDVTPTAPATRDQAAILLYQLFYYLDILP